MRVSWGPYKPAGSRATDDDGDDDRRTTPWMPFAPLDALPPLGCPDDVVVGHPPADALR